MFAKAVLALSLLAFLLLARLVQEIRREKTQEAPVSEHVLTVFCKNLRARDPEVRIGTGLQRCAPAR